MFGQSPRYRPRPPPGNAAAAAAAGGGTSPATIGVLVMLFVAVAGVAALATTLVIQRKTAFIRLRTCVGLGLYKKSTKSTVTRATCQQRISRTVSSDKSCLDESDQMTLFCILLTYRQTSNRSPRLLLEQVTSAPGLY